MNIMLCFNPNVIAIKVCNDMTAVLPLYMQRYFNDLMASSWISKILLNISYDKNHEWNGPVGPITQVIYEHNMQI